MENEDEEILKTVRSMLGANVEIVDCEKTSTVHEEEVLLINGIPIKLDGENGAAVKKALITGEMPPCDLLNEILFQAGVLRQPVHLETSLSVKSSQITKEEVIVARGGRIIDERSTETQEDNEYTSSCQEIWEPVHSSISTNSTTDKLPAKCDVSHTNSGIQKTASTKGPSSPTTSYLSNASKRLGNSSIHSSTNSSNSSVLSSVSSSSLNQKQSSTIPPLNSQAKDANGSVNGNGKLKIGIAKDHALSKTLQSISCDSGHHDDNDDDFYDSRQQQRTPNSVSSNGCYDFSDDGDSVGNDETDFLRKQMVHKMFPTSPTSSAHFSFHRPQHIFQRTTKYGGAGIDVAASIGESNRKSIDSDNDNMLVYRDGTLISGSLNSLIEHMVPTIDYFPEQSYLFAFLLSSRLFIRPNDLFARICDICDQQQTLLSNLTSSNVIDENIRTNLKCFAFNFFQLMQYWTTTFPYDFRDDRLKKQAHTMIDKCIMLDSTLQNRTTEMFQALSKRLNALELYEDECLGVTSKHINNDFTDQYNQMDGSLGHSNSFHGSSSANSSTIDIMELCSTSTQLAHHLTHIELECLSHIGPEEFVQAFAKENSNNLTTGLDGSPAMSTSTNETKKLQKPKLTMDGNKSESHSDRDKSVHQQHDIKKTRNLETYIQWFNRLSYLVASEIVKHPKKKQRVRLVEYWIETGLECFNIGNFNSLMAIIAGLNMSPISRLKKTWQKVQSAKFSVLEHQMDPTSNFISYRSTLKAAMWRSAGATDERQRIVIPFFSLLVKDLYFLNEGCSNKLANGHINFDKFWQLAKQVTEFIGWKQVQCPFERSANIIQFLQKRLICLSENSLALGSFECEPPDNGYEKDRYKLLKSEHQQNHHEIPNKH